MTNSEKFIDYFVHNAFDTEVEVKDDFISIVLRGDNNNVVHRTFFVGVMDNSPYDGTELAKKEYQDMKNSIYL